jgi:hypothetical protein
MTTPQQPELARSRRSEADPAAAKARTGGPTTEKGRTGPVPDDNLPGHHPEHDQDKPAGPPPRPKARAPKKAAAPTPPPPRLQRRSFGFEFEPRMAPFSFAVGVTPLTAKVEVADGRLCARFGPWSVRTPLDNVEAAEVTGPYSFPKVVGPPHLSLADRGLTFATSTRRGVCIRFKEPVTGALPFGMLRHPALTVTVDDPEGLTEALRPA